MPPKKAQKMSLNEFLGDSSLGSWADEMDALPTAPAAKTEGAEDRSRPGDRRRDDFLSSRPDRGPPPHREDLPLPTEPPYTAFVGNLVFDLLESDLESFFSDHPPKNVKIIKDRDEKPKGFGYVEFNDLDGLKWALSKSGESLAGRFVRISVAEPPKERSGFGGGFEDDSKFSGNWRREGPLPDLTSRDSSRRRFDGPPSREPPPPSVSDNVNDWRSTRPAARASPVAPPTDSEGPSFRRRGTGFRTQEGGSHGPADTEEKWSIGSRFKPSEPNEGGLGGRFGSLRGPPRDAPSPPDEGDWRRPRTTSRNSTSPSSSVPPTPQMGRRKLELLPRTGASATPSPLASPNPANPTAPKPNPFGAARPVDTLSKDNAVAERLEKEHEVLKERVSHGGHTMSRTSSRNASQRGESRTAEVQSRTSQPPTTPSSPKADSPRAINVSANVRPSFSFANAAAGKKDASPDKGENGVQELADKVAKTEI